jgi:hypothetical protein
VSIGFCLIILRSVLFTAARRVGANNAGGGRWWETFRDEATSGPSGQREQKIVVTALASVDCATPPEGTSAEIIVVNSFSELAAMPRAKVAGEIVVFNERFVHRMAAAETTASLTSFSSVKKGFG